MVSFSGILKLHCPGGGYSNLVLAGYAADDAKPLPLGFILAENSTINGGTVVDFVFILKSFVSVNER